MYTEYNIINTYNSPVGVLDKFLEVYPCSAKTAKMLITPGFDSLSVAKNDIHIVSQGSEKGNREADNPENATLRTDSFVTVVNIISLQPRLATDGRRCGGTEPPMLGALLVFPNPPMPISGSPGASSPSNRPAGASGILCAPNPETAKMLVRPPLVAICSCSCNLAS